MRASSWGLALVLMFASAAAGGAVQVPTTQHIQADVDSKQYQTAVREIAVAVTHGSDKSELLPIKAESLLQLKQFLPAAEAFETAAKWANDPQQRDLMRATAVLIRKSSGGIYQPKQPTTRPIDAGGGKPHPIDVRDLGSREDALRAMLADQAKVHQAKVDSLKGGTDFSAMLQELSQLDDLRAVELAGTGSGDQTAGMIQSLVTHASQLLRMAAITLSSQVNHEHDRANTIDEHDVPEPGTGQVFAVLYLKHGLDAEVKDTMANVIATTRYIASTCDEFSQRQPKLSHSFEVTKGTVIGVANRALGVLNADYAH